LQAVLLAGSETAFAMPGEEVDLLALRLQNAAQGVAEGVFIGPIRHLLLAAVSQQDIAGETVAGLLGLKGLPLRVDKLEPDLPVKIGISLEDVLDGIPLSGTLR
jgi:hypothetical protein